MISGIGNNVQPLVEQSTGGGSQDMGKDEFLKLLVAQMTHQDPLDPLGNTEMVAQLAQFSSLEQMVNVSSAMEDLALAQAVSNGTQMVEFIGKEVTIAGNSIQLNGSPTGKVSFDLQGDAESVVVTLLDKDTGEEVQTFDMGQQTAGEISLTVDGVESGQYKVKVEAIDSSGQLVEVENLDPEVYVTPSADLNFKLASNAAEVTVQIVDENGNTIRTLDLGHRTQGDNTIHWDGLNSSEQPVGDGNYTFRITATLDGEPVDVSTHWQGQITGLTYSNGYPELLIGDKRIQINDIISVMSSEGGA